MKLGHEQNEMQMPLDPSKKTLSSTVQASSEPIKI